VFCGVAFFADGLEIMCGEMTPRIHVPLEGEMVTKTTISASSMVEKSVRREISPEVLSTTQGRNNDMPSQHPSTTRQEETIPRPRSRTKNG
jgi:hypothetical protein